LIEVKLREMREAFRKKTGTRATYEWLAEQTGLSLATLQSLGSRPAYNTTLETVDRVCGALECSLTDLLEYSDGPTDDSRLHR
jgi:putative transcriptional regulator